MPEVFNWQLGRKMAYQYDAPRPKRQIAWVFDTNKCIACQTCTVACKQTWTWGRGQEYMLWNNVETKPYGFFPTGWDVRLLEMLGPGGWQNGEYTGSTAFEAAPKGERVAGWLPASEHWAYPNIGEDEPAGIASQGTYIGKLPHDMWFFYLARICNHCTYPACLAACPREAIYKRPEDGIVLIDQTRCRGYQECVSACPYKKVMFNNTTGTSEKCIACYPKIEQGEQPQCVTSCIGRIRIAGFISPPGQVVEDNPIDFLVKVRKVALPLYPQSGTEPNVYYIPPMHAPRDYSRQLFGPGTDEAIETYARAKDDPDLLGLMMLFGSTERIMHRFKVDGEIAYGFDDKGEEVVQVPLREPTFIRTYFDSVRQSYLHNIT
ncbi:MAG TPA: 4Fe-4S dicluster domain-containing protein [Dehalococcoidia bacterium]|nr:4Fe-4S dicluster domain-containing protein [Dehalococcoidia bacterium]